jgi:hypothetical protein
MMIVRNVGGGLMVLLGGIWFLQGINVLPGSFMTGSTFWAVAGAVLLLVGLVVLTQFRARPPRA